MAIRLVNGGRINNGNFESYNKETKSYESTGEKVKSSDFGASTVGGGVDYSGDNAVVQGITTSYNAANKAKNANSTIESITTPSSETESPLDALYKRLGVLQTDLKAAQEKEKLAKENLANSETGAKLDKLPTAEETGSSANADLNAGVDAIANKGNTSGIEDPVIRALADKTIANVGIINQQLQSLGQYRAQFNEYTQQDIDSIGRTAERSIERQLAENDRVKRAMEFAGVIGGRAQFAPTVQESIISEVIREGLDKIEVINEKKNSAIREARKAEAEFNIDVFEQQADLAKEYNNEIESTISAMNAQVRQVEKDERERIEFRQAQEERSSIILAEELINATPEQIAQAAVANGVDYALLTKAVNDAKFNATDKALSLEERRASINASNRANQPKAEADFSKRESALLEEAGLSDASYSEKVAFLNLTPTAQNEKITGKKEEIEDIKNKSVDEVISDVVGGWSGFKEGTDDNIKAAASSFGINPKGWKNNTEGKNFLKTIVENLQTSYPEISDAEVKEYLTGIPADATVAELTAYLQFARTGVK